MNKIERIDAVLAGRQPDRPPLSFWYHFPPDAAAGTKAVERTCATSRPMTSISSNS